MELITQTFNEKIVTIYTDLQSMTWFKANDIATILEYNNTKGAIQKHVDPEDKKPLRMLCAPEGAQIGPPLHLLETIYINESGLYSLVLRSKMTAAKQFKRWITSEILPSIRKTGEYINEQMKEQLRIEKENREIAEEKLEEKEVEFFKLQENHKRILYKRRRHKIQKGEVLYIVRNELEIENSYIFGQTTNLQQRLGQYQTSFTPALMYAIFTPDYKVLESVLKTSYKNQGKTYGEEHLLGVELKDIISFIKTIVATMNSKYTILDVITNEILDENNNVINNTEEAVFTVPVSAENQIQGPVSENEKRCSGCKKVRLKTDFNKDSTKHDNLHTTCKTCEKEAKKRYKEEKEKIRKEQDLKEKKCVDCNKVKEISEFSEHSYCADGYVNACNECMNIRLKTGRDKNKEQGRQQCFNCPKSFSRIDQLNRHLKTCNPEEKTII